jgi:hypothetical protein
VLDISYHTLQAYLRYPIGGKEEDTEGTEDTEDTEDAPAAVEV